MSEISSSSRTVVSQPKPASPGNAGPPDIEIIVGSYRLDRTIGQGTYGKVRLGIHITTDEKVAVKIIEKAQIQSVKQVARLQREIRFLKLLHHPHIVNVYDVVETDEYIYIVMEYAVGGELFDYIVAHKRVKEKEARSFFRMVLSAVDYCHQNAVIHRDLKPENLLLDERKCIKIIDFGFGNNFTLNGLLDTFCGSPFYAAPEMILGKKYEGPEVDMWSLGVILFALLCGHLPFDDDNMKELYKKISTGNYKCPDYLPQDARHLIGRLITVDPKKRATLAEVLEHKWVKEGYESSPPNYIPVRPILNDPSLLSKDITNRLQIFGYKLEDIYQAFSPTHDFSKPNPIRATYFLLSEMVAREQARIRNERRRVSGASPSESAVNVMSKTKSASVANFGKSMPMIEESGTTTQPLAHNTNKDSNIRQSQPNLEESKPIVGKDNGATPNSKAKDFSSIPVLAARDLSRRTSTPNALVVATIADSLSGSCRQSSNASELNRTAYNQSELKVSRIGADESPKQPAPYRVSRPYSLHSDYPTAHREDLPPLPGKYDSIAMGGSLRIQPGSHAPKPSIDCKDLLRRQSVPANLLSSTTAHYDGQGSFVQNVGSNSHTNHTNTGASGGGGNSQTVALPGSSKSPTAGHRVSAAGKLKEDLRAVSGWFLNVSTTSSKGPDEILEQVIKVLNASNAVWTVESKYTLHCEVDATNILTTGKSDDASPNGGVGDEAAVEAKPADRDVSSEGSTSVVETDLGTLCSNRVGPSSAGTLNLANTTNALEPLHPIHNESQTASVLSAKSKQNNIAFQIEICKVPRMSLHGVHFKRLTGGVWNYKKVCNKILLQLSL
ncbi:hypothetical protein BASA81_013562 [Batrachochytrium salamandrivorans]|nr:hypothetical protein BASA81_013562 [Batrachochytrium salamandrivorans]